MTFIGSPFIFSTLLFCCALYEIRQWQQGSASKFWKTTTGSILTAHIDTTTDNDFDEVHGPRISYSYRVNGNVYRSKRISYGAMIFNHYYQAADALQGKFKNKQITVYYDPKNPRHSVLHPGASMVLKTLIPIYVLGILWIINI